MIRCYAALASLWLACAPVLASSATDAQRLFDEYWAYEMESDPFSATTAGIHRYNERVPDVSPGAQRRYVEGLRGFLARVRALDTSGLGDGDRLSTRILNFILEHDIALARFETWRIPFNADTGFHSDFGYVVSAMPFRVEADYRAYLIRLRALPEYLHGNEANMREGLAAGFTQPREILENILPSFRAQVTASAAAHPAYAPFRSIPSAIPGKTRDALSVEARDVLETLVIPAYARLAKFMQDEYLPNARTSLGASGLPDGARYYEALVRFYTTLDEATPSEIHAVGLHEVDRIRAEMDRVIDETGFAGDFPAFLEYLRTDPQFYARTPQELLMRAAWIAKKTDGRLPAFFGKLPRQPYSVEPVPDEIAPNYTGGRYVGAPPGSDRGGRYWVNTYALNTRPLYQLPALSLHEGVPGHHLQTALAYEIEDAPEFRRHFYPHAYGEGWGLYSERLGVEMGIYETPFEHFGRLSYEMWRACRLVIDTGLHAEGWTRQQALDYLASNTALSHHSVQTEVDRYISWPGQALAYKMGELTLWELRRTAERELGADFDIRVFHDTVLAGGGLPLDLLRAQVRAYVQAATQKRDGARTR